MIRVQVESSVSALDFLLAIALTLGIFVLGIASMFWGASIFDRNLLGFLGIVASGAMAFMAVVLVVETAKHNFAEPHAYDELRTVLVSEGLSKNEAATAVEKVRELETGQDLQLDTVTVVRLENRTFLVGTEHD